MSEPRWMMLPKNLAYPNFNEAHREDDWCAKAGCVPVAITPEFAHGAWSLAECCRLLIAASHALRSYEYGNAATEPAKDMADAIDRFLATGEPETIAGKAAR